MDTRDFNDRQLRAIRNIATVAAAKNSNTIQVPSSYNQAMQTPQAKDWKRAMKKELASHRKYDVADLVP